MDFLLNPDADRTWLIVKNGTKCKFCGKDLTGEKIAATRFICKKCGKEFSPICSDHPLCPECGEILWPSRSLINLNQNDRFLIY